MKRQLPFIIIRSYGNGESNAVYTKILFEMQKKYPGLINEIWFGGCSSLEGLDVVGKLAPLSLPFRDECRKLGIRFSLQIAQTLNHSADGKKRPHFSDEAWAVDPTGEIRYGLFCPLSHEAQEYARKSTEILLRTLQPDSIWPDDDLRLSNKRHLTCFCHRCMDRFNQRFHHHFSREELTRLLETDHSAEAAAVRREWSRSNAENLGEFASVYRAAVDREAPDCMIGLQLTEAKRTYDGPDPIPRLKVIAGKDGKKPGIRPGGGYYTDTTPRDMLGKALDVQTESARCRRSGTVSQICYEAENWPHIGSEKNPYNQMTECALGLASGADSLALYWGTDINRESDDFNRFYFEVLHEFKPFLLAIRDAFSASMPSGISLYRGAKIYEQPEWMDQSHQSENWMMKNSMPVTRPETMPEAFWLDERAVRELACEDLQKCFSKAVLMNTSVFEQLSRKFPELQFTKKVELKDASTSRDAVNSNLNEMFECFEGDKLSMFLSKIILPQDSSVKPFSSVTGGGSGCGTCVIPTEFGGSVVLKQDMRWPNFWNGYRRKAILDALDFALGGSFVRLNTNGFAINVLGQKNAEGKTVGAFLLNLGCGRTMPLEFAIRNPASENYALHLPGKDPIPLTPVSRKGNGLVFKLPALEIWQPAAILPQIK